MFLSKPILFACGVASAMFLGVACGSAQGVSQDQLAVTTPVFLKLEITSACTDQGAIFKIINRGDKWPSTGFLRLYHADTKDVLGERRLRLAPGQKVSFVVKSKVIDGHPIAVWVEPEWYTREMEYDASIVCE